MEPLNNNVKANHIQQLVNDALVERREDDIPEIPASLGPRSLIDLFDRYVVVKAQEKPVLTSLAIVATFTLSAALLSVAILATVIAAAVISGLGLALVGVKILAVLRKSQKDKITQELNQLELMGVVTAKEAYAIKQTLNDLDTTRSLVVELQKVNPAFKEYLLNDGKESFCARIGLSSKDIRLEDIKLDDSKQMSAADLRKVEDKLLECVKGLQPSKFVDQLKENAKYNELGQFRSNLIQHYKALASDYKENNNMVAYYCCKEMANKIESVPEQETYITFIRFSHQLEMLKKHNAHLSNISKSISSYKSVEGHEKEISEWVSDLKKLHQYTANLLADYHVVSSEVDDIFAYYRGEFAVKYRNIESAITRLDSKNSPKFSELPLAPGVIKANKSSPSMPKAEKKVDEQHLEKKLKNITSICRSLQELPSVQEITSGGELTKSLNPDQKHSIMLVTCSFGTGHKMAARALKDLIGPSAHVSIIDPTEYESGILIKETDWIYNLGRLLGKRWSATIAFNWILQEQHYWMVNLENKVDKFIRTLFKIGGKNGVAPSARGKETKSKELLRHRILMERPNLITTTYHMDLNPFLEVSEELGLPLLHVPTDLDVKMSEVFGDSKPDYEHFRIVLPDGNEETLGTAVGILNQDQIHMVVGDGNQISVTGIVLRPEFYIQRTQAEILQLKKDRGIDPEATVIAVMSGGNGQDLPYPEMLLNSQDNGKKYHMIVVAGGNTAAGNALNSKRQAGQKFITGSNPNVTVEVLEDPVAATDANPYYVSGGAISRLHAIADVGITKPGGLSIAEFLQTGVPMIPDRRKDPMRWEDFNIGVLQRQNRGRAYTGQEDFLELIDEVKAMGKKPKPNRAGLITQQMAQMITHVEDKTDAVVVQRRSYLRKEIAL